MSMNGAQIAQPRVARQLSNRVVFEALLHKGPIARTDLAKTTGLSKQTISEVVDSFEQQGWVRAVGRTSGNVGRTAVLYEVCPQAAYVVAIHLGGSTITAAIADISCTLLAQATLPTDARGGKAVIRQISALAARLARAVGATAACVRATVIGTPGVVNPQTGVIEFAPNIAELSHLDVVGALVKRLSGRVQVENDVNLALLGEIWQGCARNSANVALIALDNGIGLGLYANGRLVRGHHGAAGELGYLPLGADPLRSQVRSQGSLEYEVGAQGIVRRYREAGGAAADTVPDIFRRLDAGDALATRIVLETARSVALAVASVVALLDPELIVLDGAIGSRPAFVRHVQQQLAHCAIRPVAVRASVLQNRAGVLGALAVALGSLHEELFGVPDLPGDLPLPTLRTLGHSSV